MRPRHLVAAIAATLISAPLWAQTVKSGITAWQKADYSAAVAIWMPLAQRGDADAQFNLGQAYRLGRGVPLDLAKAQGWFEKAANAGHLDAETTLGLLLFENGDHPLGLKWLKRAADQNEPRALLVYGTALYNGDGVGQDRILGYAYVSRAAQQGLAPAKDTLAQLDSLMPETERNKAVQLAAVRIRSRITPASQPVRSPPVVRSPTEVRARAAAKRNPPMGRTTRIAETPDAGAAHGSWRIQLGAFSKRSSAEALYRRVSSKPVLSGRSAIYEPAGAMTRLQIGPFTSRGTASAACASLGVACFAVAAKP